MERNLRCALILVSFLLIYGVLFAAENNKANESSRSFDRNQNLPALAGMANQKASISKTDLKQNHVTVTPEPPLEDAEKIQDELQQIISRTRQLQEQVKGDRSEIREILERAQIHQRILKGITIPKPIQSKQQINQDDIIAREKMRLIAQQAQITQRQLKTIQSARLHSLQTNLPKSNSSEVS